MQFLPSCRWSLEFSSTTLANSLKEAVAEPCLTVKQGMACGDLRKNLAKVYNGNGS